MRPHNAALGLGTAISAAVALCSWALAALGFGRLYYLGILLPLGAVLCALASWLLHLRDDGLIKARRSAEENPPGREAGTGESGVESAGGRTVEGPEGLSGLFARIDEGIVPRTDGLAPSAGPPRARSGRPSGRPAAALVWAAIELALLAAALRAFAGIGASYYGSL